MVDTTTWHPPTGPYSVDWFDDENWTNGVPDENKVAIVDDFIGTEVKDGGRDVRVRGLQVFGTGRVQLYRLVAEE